MAKIIILNANVKEIVPLNTVYGQISQNFLFLNANTKKSSLKTQFMAEYDKNDYFKCKCSENCHCKQS